MTAATMARRKRGGSLAKHSVPTVALLAAFLGVAILLPTALRPPPDTSTASGALNPNAPPQDNVEFVEGQSEASGGGAGAGVGASPSTTTPTTGPAGTVPTSAPPPSLSYCYGKPPRQIPSVYSGPCVGAWKGNNGGATAKNVLPNEIRITTAGGSAPPEGRLPEPSTNNASTRAGTRTWQALEEYFNRHFQLYNRKIKFYGTGDPPSDDQSGYQAIATKAADQQQAFLMNNTIVDVCKPFVRKGLVAFCDPMTRADNRSFAPGMYSAQMDLDTGLELGAEFVCKNLVGGKVKYGGPDVNGQTRKFGYIGYFSGKGGLPAERFKERFKQECGADVEVATQNSNADVQGATAAITRFRADGINTIIFYNQGINVLAAMQQADNLSFFPEWVMFGAFAVDVNLIGTLLPPRQAAHLFGTSSTAEWPQPNAKLECFQAVREIDPSLSADANTCALWWEDLVLQISAIQGAGPNLTPKTFEQGAFGLGHRYRQSPWSLGGGFGPDDKGYVDDVGLVWWSASAPNVTHGSPGAFVWIHGGRRFQRGQIPDKGAGLDGMFVSGSAVAPER